MYCPVPYSLTAASVGIRNTKEVKQKITLVSICLTHERKVPVAVFYPPKAFTRDRGELNRVGFLHVLSDHSEAWELVSQALWHPFKALDRA